MEELKKWQVLDGTMLKLIAMVSMAVDHVGACFFPEQLWLRIIGRIAMPLFAFGVAEGYCHTHDRKRYLVRMGLFALVSEVPFDLAFTGKVLEAGHQNILFTFFLAILGMLLFEKLREQTFKGRMAAAVAVLAVIAVASILLLTDYNAVGVGVVWVYCLFRKQKLPVKNLIAMGFYALSRNMGIYLYALMGFVPVFFYNGKRGRGLKWLFYVFYPGHLLLLWLIGQWI